MSLFIQAVIQKDVQNMLSTIRNMFMALGPYSIKEGNQKVIKLSNEKKRIFHRIVETIE